MNSVLGNKRLRNVLLGFLLVVTVCLAYSRVWHAGFIWDDDDHLTNNPCIIGPLGFSHIWTSSAAVYYPLVLSSFWIQHAIWGLNPLPFHVVTVLLHAASAVLLWVVLQRLGVRGAWLGAALWALHPVQVESVAWITEQKNTQSCLLYLLSIYFFLRWRNLCAATALSNSGRSFFYLLSLVSAALGILSKTSTVMLPIVLCLLWWWEERKWSWGWLMKLLPFFLISLGSGLWTVWEQKYHSGAIGGNWELDYVHRLIIAGKVPWFYLAKLIWPHPLVFIYPKWVNNPMQPMSWLPLIGLFISLFLLWSARSSRWGRASFLTATYFLVSLFPVMGFFNVYFFRYSYVGDHFQYLASIGPLSLAGAAITSGVGGLVQDRRWVLPFIASMILLSLGTLSWKQCRHYADAASIWRETLIWNPSCALANNNLGTILLHDGKVDESISHFKKAIEGEPTDPYGECNLGWALRQKLKFKDALLHFEKALGGDPFFLKCRPDFSAGVHYNMGDTLLQLGQYDEAIGHFQADMALNPVVDFAEAGIAKALLAKGDEEGAIAHLRHLHLIKPDDGPTLHTLGKLLYKRGQRTEGIAWLQASLKLQPNDTALLNDLAWMLATAPEPSLRNGPKALELAIKAVQSTGGNDPNTLDTLAATYAENGDYAKAIEFSSKALILVGSNGSSQLAQALKKENALYQKGKPLREP